MNKTEIILNKNSFGQSYLALLLRVLVFPLILLIAIGFSIAGTFVWLLDPSYDKNAACSAWEGLYSFLR